ncbi:MAG: Flp pilus assembly protein CpaB [Firmicutes bacterium]|nr:Flp pilus assembly protein CpaB [Bacillota bacterium]
MTERWRKILVTLGAFVAAVIVYISFHGLEAQYRWRTETVPMVVASTRLRAGTLLEASHLAVREVPRQFRPESALGSIHEATGKVLVSDLDAGQELTRVNIVKPDQIKDLRRRIPVGHRAVFLPVAPESGIGHHLRPGARVDLIAVSGESGWDQEQASTIAQDVAVLDVVSTEEAGRSLLGADEGRSSPAAVALAVTPLQAQLISLAQQTGKVEIVLRPDNDRALNVTLPSAAVPGAPAVRTVPPAVRPVQMPVAGSGKAGWDESLFRALTELPAVRPGGGTASSHASTSDSRPPREGLSTGAGGSGDSSDRVVEVIHGTESVRQSVESNAPHMKGD